MKLLISVYTVYKSDANPCVSSNTDYNKEYLDLSSFQAGHISD